MTGGNPLPVLMLAAAVIAIDQWSKYYVAATMGLGTSKAIIPGVFHLTYILNPGAAFGILENQRFFFIVVALLMVAAVVYVYPRISRQHLLLRAGTGLMTGGAVGNVIDRVNIGQVIDFFDFRVWPIFNIADTAIVIGVTCIIYTMLFITEKKDEAVD